MKRSICIHGHFYQPPRENPWLEEVELQDSAYPYHDWNERITFECYAPNTASRILDPGRKIIDIVNNYAKMSFNFGPTLLTWMRRHTPEVYQAVLDADKESQKIFSGHGSAIAQCYNHMIMPLAVPRDKRTQVIWGLRDFRYRFGREPEGMWLPETAVDLETLDIMAGEGIKFTMLAPGQARRIRKIGTKEWREMNGEKIDPKMPYVCRLPSGRSIALFFYDGPISHDIAFGALLKNGEDFARRMISAFEEGRKESQLVHIATDGETYGHHQRFGDMALAYCLYYIETNKSDGLRVSVYGEYLDRVPPVYEVEIHENSSWSCFHGVERWKNDCGCNSGTHPGWKQAWRAPLRGALDWLQDNLARVYEEQLSPLIADVWQARDDYIEVILDRTPENVERFLSGHASRDLGREEKIKVLKLLEMQRHAMLMYTSCGWFFDEVSGIETVQILQYAARAIQLAREVNGISLEDTFTTLLERAPSNIPEYKNAANVYDLFVRPSVLDLLRVGVHYAVSSLFKENRDTAELYSYSTANLAYEISAMGKQKLATGRVRVRSNVTWEENEVSFAVFHFGDQNLVGAAREFMGEEPFAAMQKELKDSFSGGGVSEIVHVIDRHFGHDSYSLWHLFKDEQRKILNQIFDGVLREVNTSFRQIYRHNVSLVQLSDKLKFPLPKALVSVAEYVLNTDIIGVLEAEDIDLKTLDALVNNIRRFSLSFDKNTINFVASRRINAMMEDFSRSVENVPLLEAIIGVLKILSRLSLDLDLWKAQNLYFFSGKQFVIPLREKSVIGEYEGDRWFNLFEELGEYLGVRID